MILEWLTVGAVGVFLAAVTCPYDRDDIRDLIRRVVRR